MLLMRGETMVVRLVVQMTILLAFMALLLFGAAGTTAWAAGWIYLAELGTLSMAAGLWLARRDPALLAERMASPVQRGQPLWDRVFLSILLPAWFGWLAFMPLDAVRYRWSHVPAWGQVLGALAILVAVLISVIVMRENSYAAPVVRLQAERGQTVVTTGPYRFVRHPMYAGAIPFFIGTPLLLGSWYGVALAPLLIAGLAVRAVMEEKTLRAGLAGYADYAARVRYRLIPGIW